MKKFLSILFLIVSLFSFRNTPSSNCIAQEVVTVPILMYHSILKSRKGEYIVSPDDLKNDLLWLKNHGYESSFVSDLIKYCEGTGDLPQKPVVITFDDGQFNNYYYAKPIFEELKFKATINIVGSYTEFSTSSGDFDNPNYSHLTWEEIKLLQENDFFFF